MVQLRERVRFLSREGGPYVFVTSAPSKRSQVLAEGERVEFESPGQKGRKRPT